MPKKSKTAKKPLQNSKSKTIVVDGHEMSLEESLDRARIALESSQAQMLSLHRSWRSQLQRLCIMSLFLVLKQASIPAYDCLDQVETYNNQNNETTNNNNNNNNNKMKDFETAQRILSDSLMEVFCLLCCLCLIVLLHQTGGKDFSNPFFKLSLLSVPLIVACYYLDPMVGCLGELEGFEEKPRSFPVTLILLAVVYGSLYAMKYQQHQQAENLQKVQKLRDDLVGTKKDS